MNALHDFHFLRPWWLLALLLVPLVWAVASRTSTARRELSRLVDAELLPHLIQGGARSTRWSPVLLALALTLCVMALAGPTWSRVVTPLYANRSAQVIAISLSHRMQARDVAPSRLDRARMKTHELLAANKDGLNGLIAYAGDAFAVAPLTNDAASLTDLLNALSPDTMPAEGDNAAQAIERGVRMIQDAKAGHGSIVLVTDSANDAAIAAARKAAMEGITVSVLGVGTTAGGAIPLADGSFVRGEQGALLMARRDDASLRAMAEAGDGRFVVMAGDHADIDTLHEVLRSEGLGSTATDARSDDWQDGGAWFLLPLLPLAALGFRRGWVWVLVLACLPAMPGTARADGWTDLWKRPDQQAAQALKDGQPAQAQQVARDPAWRGAADYRAGDFDAAAQSYAKAQGADAAYNQGNALARNHQFKEAIAAYDRALKLDPHHQDAQANRKAVEDWLRQQKPSDAPKQADENERKGKGKDGQPQGSPNDAKNDKPGEGEEKDQDKQDPGKASNSPQDANGKGKDQPQPNGSPQPQDAAAKPPSAEEESRQKEQAEKAREALRKQLDEQMQAKATQAQAGKDAPHDLGEINLDDPQSKLPDDVRRALQRVPDDPGALLRRKFELEYRQRHGMSAEEEQ